MANVCEDCGVRFLVQDSQDGVNVEPYCPNCGNNFCTEFEGVVDITVKDAFVKKGDAE